MIEDDKYKTINTASENVLFKDKNSKFYGYAFPVKNEEEAKHYLEQLKKEHHNARHWCYAYQLGTESIIYRANDDGEPNNSAGMPIYGQIQSFEVTNILIVVVRYFGGVKLGVSGLINAYKTTASLTLQQCNIITKTININYLINFKYEDMNKVMRIVKENQIDIINQKLELDCKIIISVRKKSAKTVFNLFDTLFGVEIKPI
ncbi:IMPACT family protein [Aestuariivivens marinum]|uniref:IMPACT family protein n=1 Tax=Aestuariivivens marinum TaxID=2913555 RepID=UPI001F58A8D0|nr:YigZ family protein [Aestuariivivens marinum]